MTRTRIQISNPRDLPQLMVSLAFLFACDNVPQAGFEPGTANFGTTCSEKEEGRLSHLVAQLQ